MFITASFIKIGYTQLEFDMKKRIN